LTNQQPARRRARIVTTALSLVVLAATLLGPSQTFAQTHKAACAATRGKAARACSSHKGKHKRKLHHGGKNTTKRKAAKTKTKGGASRPVILVPALCEDGSKPVRAGADSFTCEDGSEPSCEDNVAPTTSRNGRTLLCPAPGESEASAGEGESQGECEEEESLSCTPVTESDSGEKVCEISPSAGSSVACEGER
jgi:hypothetical protein